MDPTNICESCSMPISSAELQGTEKDGSKNKEYCFYCYQQGAFVNPTMSLKEMTDLVVRKMEQFHMKTHDIDTAVKSLPYLKRWVSRKMHA